MTAENLAVIFGPNLLQKEKGSDKDLKPEAMGIEDSAAIISVTLLFIQHYKNLFMVRVRESKRDECCRSHSWLNKQMHNKSDNVRN